MFNVWLSNCLEENHGSGCYDSHCLDGNAVNSDLADLAEDGIMIYDGDHSKFKSNNPNHFSIPLEQIAE